MKSIAGFQDVKFLRAGYAIEYDYFPPTQLRHTLETKLVGLQDRSTERPVTKKQLPGLMAGINAHLKVHEKSL
jgi:tRNA uridine 5-carboxymethylaminomethyl modification enzyme